MRRWPVLARNQNDSPPIKLKNRVVASPRPADLPDAKRDDGVLLAALGK